MPARTGKEAALAYGNKKSRKLFGVLAGKAKNGKDFPLTDDGLCGLAEKYGVTQKEAEEISEAADEYMYGLAPQQNVCVRCLPGETLYVPGNGTVTETECSEVRIQKSADGHGYVRTYVTGVRDFADGDFGRGVFVHRQAAERRAEDTGDCLKHIGR